MPSGDETQFEHSHEEPILDEITAVQKFVELYEARYQEEMVWRLRKCICQAYRAGFRAGQKDPK